MINAGLWRKEIIEGKTAAAICCMLTILAAVLVMFYPAGWLIQFYETPRQYLGDSFVSSSMLPHYYIWSVYISRLLILFASLAGFFLGIKSFAGEIAGGTAVFLSSRPVSSRDLVTSKLFAGASLLAVSLLPSALLFTALSGRYLPGSLEQFWGNYLVLFLGAVAVYVGTMFFSSLVSRPWKAGVAAALFWGVACLTGFGESSRIFSLFHHMRAPQLWVGTPNSLFIHLGAVLVLVLVFYELTVLAWGRREL